jgi:hypothetical protein
VICENVRVALPVLLRVTGCEFALPTVTVPKLILVGLAEASGLPGCPLAGADADAEVNPEQPESDTLAIIAMKVARKAKVPPQRVSERMAQLV